MQKENTLNIPKMDSTLKENLNEGFTHIEEGAGVLQYELTGVWFVLTVIHINVELISLKNRRGENV